MLSWSRQKQLSILGTLGGIVVLLGALLYLLFLKPTASCTDGVKSGDELGVDCGGSCKRVCPLEVSALRTIWTRIFSVSPRTYDVAALIENSNVGYAVPSLRYTFKVYDDRNVLIVERDGTTFVNEKERFVVFEPVIDVGERIPTHATLTFETVNWVRHTNGKSSRDAQPAFNIQNKRFVVSPKPRLTAELLGDPLRDAHGVEVRAVVYDGDGTAVGVSSTLIDTVKKGSIEQLFFTWQEPFANGAVATELYPRTNVLAP